tara:strand:- start:188 stop:619 length:432 start_codon:yes stop_codon:yes gene_type:complete
MTFHLARGLTTLNTRKPKPRKMTVKRLQNIKKLWREHNKYMKKIKANSCIMTFDEYVKYTQGKYKSKRKIEVLADPFGRDIAYSRPSEPIPMSNTIGEGTASKKEHMQYTGKRKLLGIATMHKSNMVPVWEEEDAKDIARMRR